MVIKLLEFHYFTKERNICAGQKPLHLLIVVKPSVLSIKQLNYRNRADQSSSSLNKIIINNINIYVAKINLLQNHIL